MTENELFEQICVELYKDLFGDVNLYKTIADIGSIESGTVVVAQVDLPKAITFISPAYDLAENPRIETIKNSDRSQYLVVHKP